MQSDTEYSLRWLEEQIDKLEKRVRQLEDIKGERT